MLKGGLVFGALALLGSGLAIVRTSGYEVPAERRSKLAILAPWQWVFVTVVARRMVAPDRPVDSSIPSPDDVDVAGFVDGYVARMPAALRRDLSRAFVYVEHIAPLAAGHTQRFTRLSAEAQDAVLRALETNENMMLRGAFEGIKALVMMGYYRDARTWKILGYDGPLLRRPPGGWTR
jgi:hypothetical protein